MRPSDTWPSATQRRPASWRSPSWRWSSGSRPRPSMAPRTDSGPGRSFADCRIRHYEFTISVQRTLFGLSAPITRGESRSRGNGKPNGPRRMSLRGPRFEVRREGAGGCSRLTRCEMGLFVVLPRIPQRNHSLGSSVVLHFLSRPWSKSSIFFTHRHGQSRPICA